MAKEDRKIICLRSSGRKWTGYSQKGRCQNLQKGTAEEIQEQEDQACNWLTDTQANPQTFSSSACKLSRLFKVNTLYRSPPIHWMKEIHSCSNPPYAWNLSVLSMWYSGSLQLQYQKSSLGRNEQNYLRKCTFEERLGTI